MNHFDIAQSIVRGTHNCFNKDKTFTEHSFIYKKTNERLQDILDIFSDKDKILCVIGSGDQILNALLNRPQKIDAFDISIYPKYFLELKIAAIKTLTREEFIDFFINDINYKKEDYYDDLFYEKIIKELDGDVRDFWKYLFDFNDWYDIYNSMLFSTEPVIKEYALVQNKYLNEEEYYKLREILKTTKINYIQSDILNLDIDDNYDLIYLSNIIQYVDPKLYKTKIEGLSEKTRGIIVTYLFGGLENALDFFEGVQARSIETNSILIHQGKNLVKRK